MFRNLLRYLLTNCYSTRTLRKYHIFFKSSKHLNLFFFKAYEKDIWDSLKYYVSIPKNSTVLDIGANIGQSQLILHSLYNKIKVISYEPGKQQYKFLIFNSLSNNLNSQNYNLGVSNVSKKTHLKLDEITGGRLSEISEKKNCNEKLENIEVLSFRDEVEKHNPYLVKIDVEGYENTLFKYDSFDFLNNIIIMLEVREYTDKEFLKNLLKTHRLFILESREEITHIIDNFPFCNLLYIPKK
tara:strand:+ start:706 stop:1428 length:723 start_codon:yes stop_codon:yes gene_type:complete